jgi:hypothetical protein
MAAPDWLETMQSVTCGVGQWSTLIVLGLGLGGPRQGWTWAGSGRPGPDRTRVAHWCNHVVGSGSYWAFGSPGVAHRGLARAANGPKDRFAVGSAHRSFLPLLVHNGLGEHGCSSPFPAHKVCPPAVNGRLGGYWSRVVHPPLLSSTGGRQGRLNVVPMTDRHGGALARL